MRIAILGASGRTGRQLAAQALAAGHYRVSTRTPPGAHVARADVADFILRELQEHRHARQAPFIAR